MSDVECFAQCGRFPPPNPKPFVLNILNAGTAVAHGFAKAGRGNKDQAEG
jgi:hypothetical protein